MCSVCIIDIIKLGGFSFGLVTCQFITVCFTLCGLYIVSDLHFFLKKYALFCHKAFYSYRVYWCIMYEHIKIASK